MAQSQSTFTLDEIALDRLMPMHLVISGTGHIRRVAPTLAKMHPDITLLGMRLLELFEFKRPRAVTSIKALKRATGTKLHLRCRMAPFTSLKGVLVELPGHDRLLLNLSFGISIMDAVRAYNLTSSDFAPTDLAIEMLYLAEAKSAVLDESRNLNIRLQGARIAAEERAFTDTLTGLKNRRALDHVLDRLISRESPFALMQLDLDYFKDVNDTRGHAAGDQVLQQVASILVDVTRPEDTVARIGGDEFVLIFDRLVDKKKLIALAKRVIARLEVPVMFGDRPCRISGSIGVCTTEMYDPVEAETMLADSDAALYRSKGRGRACVTMATASRKKSGPPRTRRAQDAN